MTSSNLLRTQWMTAVLLAAVLAVAGCNRPDTCEGRSTCVNGYLVILSSCTCFCENQWQGQQCDECLLTDDDCNNGYANGTECRCECEPGFCGVDCEVAILNCENGGNWNDFSCACDCPPEWAGAVCDSLI